MANDKKSQGAIHLKDDNFDEEIKKANQPILLDFYAEWCGPCVMAAPIVDKLADEYRGKMLIAKIDVDANPKISQRFGVMSMPTVFIIEVDDKGKVKELAKKIGFGGEDGYRQLIDDVLKSKTS